MQANELRIGNLVYFNGTLEKIDLDSFHGMVAFDCFDSYNPIPLTEEWLIKFGSTRQISYIGKVYDCHGLQVYETDDDGWHLGNEETHLEIESVHQLQNLYFSLTGKELTIK